MPYTPLQASQSHSSSPLLPSPVLALGCTDGAVRLLSLATLKPIARLVGQHRSPVVSLTVMGMRQVGHGASLLLQALLPAMELLTCACGFLVSFL